MLNTDNIKAGIDQIIELLWKRGCMIMNKPVSIICFLSVLALIGQINLCIVFAGEQTETGDTHVVILATSDMHGNVWGYSYEDGKETTNNGMARLYTYIQQVRSENTVVFLVDAGDDIQGTIMTDDIANKNPDQEHPVITAMNYMG